MSPITQKPINIAIIGGGFAGLSLAIGLQKYSYINVQVYEAAHQFSEVGAGVVLGPNSQRAMTLIDPRIREGFERRAAYGIDKPDENGLYSWMTLYKGQAPDINKLIVEYKYHERGSTIHRAHFLDELIQLVEPSRAHFDKRVDHIYETDDPTSPTVLHFADGTTANADIVIGADGIHSAVRKHILGPNDPAANATFTGNVMYRATVPMDVARAKLGDIKQAPGVRGGKNATVMAFPLSNMTLYYIGVHTFNVKSWDSDKWVKPADVKAAKELVKDWDDFARKQVELLPEDGSTTAWSIWDMPPAKSFFKGPVAMMGDAAHGTMPHQGAGAGQAIEDALVLERVLGAALDPSSRSGSSLALHQVAPMALQAYDTIRRFRAQRVVTTSRETARLMSMNEPGVEPTAAELGARMQGRQKWIWDIDQEGQVKDALLMFDAIKDSAERDHRIGVA